MRHNAQTLEQIRMLGALGYPQDKVRRIMRRHDPVQFHQQFEAPGSPEFEAYSEGMNEGL